MKPERRPRAEESDLPINVREYEARADRRLSPMARDYYASGAWDEVTLRDNCAAFTRYQLRPRVLVDVSRCDLRVRLLGQTLPLPLLIAPMAFQCLAHPDGELATARAAAELGAVMVLSTLATRSLEDVAAAGTRDDGERGPQWFQLYIHRDRGLTRALAERAAAAGYAALCLTVDAPLLGQRERDRRNRFALPDGLTLGNLTAAALPERAGESGLFSYFLEQIDPALTWADVEWLEAVSPLPLVLKGILRGDDAARAVEHGARAVVVSNHGGRQLDGAIASLDALADVAAAVADRADVLLDGGIRRGTDVLKALALGAQAVLIGRPVLWGLAVGGEGGVRHVITLLGDELRLAMALGGCPTRQDITPDLVMRSSR